MGCIIFISIDHPNKHKSTPPVINTKSISKCESSIKLMSLHTIGQTGIVSKSINENDCSIKLSDIILLDEIDDIDISHEPISYLEPVSISKDLTQLETISYNTAANNKKKLIAKIKKEQMYIKHIFYNEFYNQTHLFKRIRNENTPTSYIRNTLNNIKKKENEYRLKKEQTYIKFVFYSEYYNQTRLFK